MRRILTFLLSLFLLTSFQQLLAQEKRDTGSIREYKNEFWDSIKTAADKFAEKKEKPEMKFMMNFEGYDLPKIGRAHV